MCQPMRSFPLKSDTQLSAAKAEEQKQIARMIAVRFMVTSSVRMCAGKLSMSHSYNCDANRKVSVVETLEG